MEVVLSIPELAESILLLLSPQDLLVRVPRVCKAWQTLINQSPPLQRKLFLMPAPQHRHRDFDSKASRRSPSNLVNPFSTIISLARPSSPSFAFPTASWRRMLVTHVPIPMYLYEHSLAFGNIDRLFFSESRDDNDPRFTGQSLDKLTFGDIERLVQGRKAHVVVFCYGMVVWTKAAFTCEIDGRF